MRRLIFSRLLILASVVLLATLLAVLAACNGGPARDAAPSSPSAPADGAPSGGVVVADANFPSALAFAPDGRLFYNELKTGDIRIVLPSGELLAEPFAHFEVATQGEWGLLGIAVDPEFETQPYIYVYYMAPVRQGVARPVVARLRAEGDRGVDATVLLGDLPPTDPPYLIHVAGHIHFGPDGYLYVAVGEFGANPDNAQDLSTVKGKLLRIDKRDGSAAAGNPFSGRPDADPRIFAYGLRNPFDFTFQPDSGRIYAADNGPDRCDELDLVLPGYNYGWPYPYSGETCVSAEGVQASYNFSREGRQAWQAGSPVAPTGLEFPRADVYPRLGPNTLLACEWLTGNMRALRFGDDGSVQDDAVIRGDCKLDVAQSPDGVIYYSNASEIRRLRP